MSNATAEIPMANADAQGRRFHLPVNSGSQIYKGTLVAQLTATGKLVPFSTAASGPAIGKATHDVLGDGTNRCLIESECKYRIANGAGPNAFSEATQYGVPVYGSDDHTASLTSVGDTLKRIGWFQGMEPDGRVLVHVSTFDYSAATAAILFPLTRVQFVTGTLVGGTCTVTVGANQAVTALTKAFPIPAAVITGSTNFGSLAHLIASNVVGGSGVGQVVIRALGNDGAQDVDAAGTFHAFLVD